MQSLQHWSLFQEYPRFICSLPVVHINASVINLGSFAPSFENAQAQ